MRPLHLVVSLACRPSSVLAHPGLLPVVGASKELANDEDGTIDYLLVSKKCVPRPCPVLRAACRARLTRASSHGRAKVRHNGRPAAETEA